MIPTAPPAPQVIDFIDLFVQQLQRTGDAGRQMSAALDMVRGAARADLAVVLGANGGEVLAWSADAPPDPRAAVALGRRLIAQARDGDGEWLGPLPDAAGSAGVARLSRSRGLWLIAFRLGGEPLSAQDLKVMTLARRLLVQQQQAQDGQADLREVMLGLVRCLTATLDARDPYTCGHSERVARIAVRLGEQLRLPEAMRSELYLGGLLHDVGKIGVPDEILRKADRLTDEEFEQVKRHPVIGDVIVSQVRRLAHLRPMVRNHHERFDGQGYPDSLAGEQIPLAARIMAVADACDAMSSDRPYRKGMPAERVAQILCAEAGRQWDPRLIEAFLDCKEDALRIAQHGLGESVYQAIDHVLRVGAAARSALATQPSAQG